MKATDREKRILYLLVQGMTKAELIDAIASGSKLTKADAGRMMASMKKKEFDEFLIGNERTMIIDAISAGAKLTKADAGRALGATIEAIHKKLKVVFGGKGQRKLKTVFGGKGQITK
ncbi:MAG: hypothetical protein IPM51_10395 [Sphingobacteriaceae bacterium]|nr:hypothetical protein [Sphingobacteriaceae bacterium]